MKTNISSPTNILIIILTSFLLSACNTLTSPVVPPAVPANSASPTVAVATPSKPDWFSIPLTDVRTDKSFTINDFAGKVVLVQTMVQWCPSCLYQQIEVTRLFTLLGNPDNLVSISLDVDPSEDQASLKKYADQNGFDWRFAVAPLEVGRALGNLYSAEYLNGPLDPMLFIDRSGSVYGLPYGLKSASALKLTLAQYLQQ